MNNNELRKFAGIEKLDEGISPVRVVLAIKEVGDELRGNRKLVQRIIQELDQDPKSRKKVTITMEFLEELTKLIQFAKSDPT